MAKADSLIGKQLDEYRLEKLLGQGGMARVYRAVDSQLKRYVAVKVIDAQFREDSEYERRFELEAQSLGQLEHPNVVSLYRYGRVDDVLYMAMRYVEGSDLKTVLDDYHAVGEFMAVEEALRILREAALALDYVHERGIIHRDVKPANIMLAKDGRAVLTDFGLALMTEVGTMGEIFGTPQYLSPEQAISSATVVPQSDIYSLGIIAYEMFTGRIPFDSGTAMDVALMQMNDTPPPPREIRAELTEAVENALLKALEKEPSERYQSGLELVDALEVAVTANSELKKRTTSPRLSIPQKVALELEKNPLPPLMIPAAVTPVQKKSAEMPSITERASDTVPNSKPPTIPHQAAETQTNPPQKPRIAAPPRATTEQPQVKLKSKPNPVMQYAPYAIGGIIVALVLIIGGVLLFGGNQPDLNATATALQVQVESLTSENFAPYLQQTADAQATAILLGTEIALTEGGLFAFETAIAQSTSAVQTQTANNLLVENAQTTAMALTQAVNSSVATENANTANTQTANSIAETQNALNNNALQTQNALTNVAPQAQTRAITLNMNYNGDKWLLLRNLTEGTSLDLAPLRITSVEDEESGGGGIRTISGLWLGQGMFLQVGQCVAYGKENELDKLDLDDCELIATFAIEEGRNRIWKDHFNVYYDNGLNAAPLGTCTERRVCTVTIQVRVDG